MNKKSPSPISQFKYPLIIATSAVVVALMVKISSNPQIKTPDASEASTSLHTLVFADDFNGNTLNTGVWNYRTDVKHDSTQRPQNVSLANGIMSVNLKADRTIILDNNTPGYTEHGGGWDTANNTLVKGAYNNNSRYSCWAGSYARWAPTVPESGLYKIYVHKVAYANSDPSAKVDVLVSGQIVATKTVNYQAATGWEDLGSYQLTSGNNAIVQVAQRSNCLRADAVKFVQLSGGGIVSKSAFRYGYYEARMKMPSASGWHSSFWLTTGDGSSTLHSKARTEIDVIETDSNNQTKGYHFIHRYNNNPGNPYLSSWCSPTGGSRIVSSQTDYGPYKYDLGINTASSFNTYGVEWNEDTVTYSINGVKKCTQNYPHTDGYHIPVNIWLTSIASATLSPPVIDTSLPSRVEVDYVRYSQKDVYIDNNEQGYSEAGTGWANSSLVGFSNSNSRYTFGQGATATWRPNLPAAGDYQIYLYKITSGNGDPDAQIEIQTPAGKKTMPVNFYAQVAETAAGPAGWQDLGIHSLSAGNSVAVTLVKKQGSDAWKAIRADAVKFIRIR